jgi:hypothetical protein
MAGSSFDSNEFIGKLGRYRQAAGASWNGFIETGKGMNNPPAWTG